MKAKNDMAMMEMFNLIVQGGISPNQFYLLYSIKHGVSPVHINIHQELRAAISNEFLKDLTNAEGNKYELLPKAHSLIDQVEMYFRVEKKKTAKQLMGDNYHSHIDEYIKLFPPIKLPSGKYARSDRKNLELAFRWFIATYDYSWVTILRATAAYVDEYERNNYMYMQTSQYFIRKQQSDKSWSSELANVCARIESGDTEPDTNFFTEKVV